MARAGKQQRSRDARSTTEAATAPPASGKAATPLQMWFEEHWHGWIKPVTGLLLLLGAYIGYNQHWIPEPIGGPMLVVVLVGGTIALVASSAYPLLETQNARIALSGFIALWALATGYPPLRAALPRRALVEKRVGETKEHLRETLSIPGESGPYELTVAGRLKGAGENEASYQLSISGDNGTSESVSGAIKRELHSYMTSRRGGRSTVAEEHGENVHRLEQVRGQTLTVSLDGSNEQLENGLLIAVRKAGLNPYWFLGLALLCAIVGLVIDYRLASAKVKTYFTMAAGFLAVFSWQFVAEATPSFLVPPAVGCAFTGFFTGGLLGALVGFVARQLKPPAQMKAKIKQPQARA